MQPATHPAPRDIVDCYFRAMAAGQRAQEDLLALFAPDATYIEPFAGQMRTHEGLPAIRACIEASWAYSPPDLTLKVDRIDADGESVFAAWTCRSPAFPAPVHGEDRYLIEAGRIKKLEVRIV